MVTDRFLPAKYLRMNCGKLVKEARVARGWSQEGLARRVNLSQGAIKKIEDGKTVKSKHLPAIAQELGIELALLDPSLKKPAGMSGATAGGLRQKVPSMSSIGQSLFGERDLPVYGTAAGGTGCLVLSTDPYTLISRPHNLIGIRDALAILIVGNSMAREYSEGDIAYCNPYLLPRIGDACVFQSDVDGTVEAVIKYLEKAPEHSDTQWFVSQSNPEKSFTLDKRKWQRCWVLVGKQSGR